MFTGIIESVGCIQSLLEQQGAKILQIECSNMELSDTKIGDSIAVNGVCLTATEIHADGFLAQVSAETLDRSCFCYYQSGQKVNLEKALQLSSRLGGHLVSGHVDGIGTVENITEKESGWDLFIKAPKDLNRYIAEKGSVCIDGISLTVNEIIRDCFRLTIVSHTLENTIIKSYKRGTKVNIEVDQIARYIESLLCADDSNQVINRALLQKQGFIK